MSRLYTEAHRSLQDEFETRRMADRIEERACRDAVGENEKYFIESRDMFFLSTVDSNGCPTVSYKGGDPGFIKVLDEKSVIFPSYDGNGMFLSMGNIQSQKNVGLLFIDFEKPHRVRLQGTAELSRDPTLLGLYKEATFVVVVTVSAIFLNCPRYIHRHQKVQASRYVPRENIETPLATWKRVENIQDVLPSRDAGKAEKAGGVISEEEWIGKIISGAEDA